MQKLVSVLIRASMIMAVGSQASSAMLNPYLSGVRAIEVACTFSSGGFAATDRERICAELIRLVAAKVGLPVEGATPSELPRSAPGPSGRLGVLWIELEAEASKETYAGSLSWGRSAGMSGVDPIEQGEKVSVSRAGDRAGEESMFLQRLLMTLPF